MTQDAHPQRRVKGMLLGGAPMDDDDRFDDFDGGDIASTANQSCATPGSSRAQAFQRKKTYARWLELPEVGFWSVDATQLEAVDSAAREALAMSERFKSDWNYGNAVHECLLIEGSDRAS